ncbi:MAG: RDD family protein [Nitrospirota bacterium]
MTAETIQSENSEAQKTNRNLAIGVGVLGFGAFALFYILFFAVMITRPGLLFQLMPVPSITDAALSDGNKTFLLVQKLDMSNVNPREKKPPETKHFLTVLEGTEPGVSQEIPAYEQALGANGRLVFLNKGSYRTFDGVRWAEERSDRIGRDPRGILTPDGLYVLSSFETGPRLSLIGPGKTGDVPLPSEYLTAEKKDRCPCSRLAWYQGRLCLFWTADDSIAWAVFNGSTWSSAAASPYSGGYEVIADDRSLYFFHREGEGPDRSLSYYLFTSDAWSGPVRLQVPGVFTSWDVFIQQGKLKLYTQHITSQALHTIEQENLVDPVRLKAPFDPASMLGNMALIMAGSLVLTVLAVFGFSALINKFKQRMWTEHGAEYEFASLFRRFLATSIDNLLLLVPSAIVIALLFSDFEAIPGNPLRFMCMMFFAMALFFVGGYLYHSLLEGLYGQTLGKKLCGIRVLKADFTPCGLSAGFLRNLLRIVDAFFYYLVAAISLAGTMKWQRLGDLVAETVVVREKKRETIVKSISLTEE